MDLLTSDGDPHPVLKCMGYASPNDFPDVVKVQSSIQLMNDLIVFAACLSYSMLLSLIWAKPFFTDQTELLEIVRQLADFSILSGLLILVLSVSLAFLQNYCLFHSFCFNKLHLPSLAQQLRHYPQPWRKDAQNILKKTNKKLKRRIGHFFEQKFFKNVTVFISFYTAGIMLESIFHGIIPFSELALAFIAGLVLGYFAATKTIEQHKRAIQLLEDTLR